MIKINHELNIGCKFGALTVLNKAKENELVDIHKHAYYVCECDCGNTLLVRADHIINGNTRQCSDCGKSVRKSIFVEYVGGEILEI